MIYIHNDTNKDCRKKFFHVFEDSCVFDNKLTNMEKIDEIILTITLGYMNFKSQLYGIIKKNQKCTEQRI